MQCRELLAVATCYAGNLVPCETPKAWGGRHDGGRAGTASWTVISAELHTCSQQGHWPPASLHSSDIRITILNVGKVLGLAGAEEMKND